jgi:hypothetical protein
LRVRNPSLTLPLKKEGSERFKILKLSVHKNPPKSLFEKGGFRGIFEDRKGIKKANQLAHLF